MHGGALSSEIKSEIVEFYYSSNVYISVGDVISSQIQRFSFMEWGEGGYLGSFKIYRNMLDSKLAFDNVLQTLKN